MEEPWRDKLRAARERLDISQRELADRSGLSVETVRGYETGRRGGTREGLKQLLTALGITAYESMEILEAAGFAAPPTLFPEAQYPDYFFTIEELQSEVERVPWPEFAISSANEVVAANHATQKLWDIDFREQVATLTPVQRNLLSVASDRHFADRVVNWDECVGVMAAVFKGRPANPGSMDNPDAYLAQVLAEFATGDPAFLAKLLKIWTETPARPAKARWDYSVVWREEEFGELRFHCIVSTASEPGALSFNDWIPMDAETWIVLERVKSRKPTARPRANGRR